MRLIDADTLKEAIKNDIYVVDYGVEGAIYGMFWSGIENAIDEQPTVEKKAGKWVHGEELNSKGITPPRGTDCRHFKGDTRKFWDAITYCSVCYREAYCDTDYGDQLFEYCPYCGSRMENGGEDD